MVTSGLICLEDDYHFMYKVGRIDYMEWGDEFEYIISPNYAVIDMLPDHLFHGIPGIDLSLRQKTYKSLNITPAFIAERTPSPNIANLRNLLEDKSSEKSNRLDWLIKTNHRYFGDRLFVILLKNHSNIQCPSVFDLPTRRNMLIKRLLEIICFGDYIKTKEIEINDANRAEFYRFLMPLYVDKFESGKRARLRGIEQAKARNAYKGRKPITLSPILFDKYMTAFLNKQITAAEAAKKLGICRATFFNKLKIYKNKI